MEDVVLWGFRFRGGWGEAFGIYIYGSYVIFIGFSNFFYDFLFGFVVVFNGFFYSDGFFGVIEGEVL